MSNSVYEMVLKSLYPLKELGFSLRESYAGIQEEGCILKKPEALLQLEEEILVGGKRYLGRREETLLWLQMLRVKGSLTLYFPLSMEPAARYRLYERAGQVLLQLPFMEQVQGGKPGFSKAGEAFCLTLFFSLLLPRQKEEADELS